MVKTIPKVSILVFFVYANASAETSPLFEPSLKSQATYQEKWGDFQISTTATEGVLCVTNKIVVKKNQNIVGKKEWCMSNQPESPGKNGIAHHAFAIPEQQIGKFFFILKTILDSTKFSSQFGLGRPSSDKKAPYNSGLGILGSREFGIPALPRRRFNRNGARI